MTFKEKVNKNIFIVVLAIINIVNGFAVSAMANKGIILGPVSDATMGILLIAINIVGYAGHYRRTRYCK